MSSPKIPRKEKVCLTTQQKLELIRQLEEENKKPDEIAASFKVDIGTVYRIKRQKTVLQQQVESGRSLNRKRTAQMAFGDIDQAMLTWFREMRSKGMPLSGPIMKNKATQFAQDFGIVNFKASNGWLDQFKKRQYNFKSIDW